MLFNQRWDHVVWGLALKYNMLSNFLYQYIYFCNILIVVKWSITQKHQDVFASPLFGSIFHLRKHSCTWRRKWQTTPVFLPGESHGQKSLEGYNP